MEGVKGRTADESGGRGSSSLEMSKWCCNQQEEGKEELVLEHIILDMMGNSVTGENFANPAVHRAFRRKRRLLDRTNTVLVSRMAIMVLFALMLICTSLVTWYYTSSYSKRAVNHAAYVMRRQMLRSSLQSMSLILQQSSNLSSALSSLHQDVLDSKGANPAWDSVQDEFRRINWAFFKSHAELSSVGLLNSQGYAVDYAKMGAQDFLFYVNESSPPNAASWYMQNVTGSGIGVNNAVNSSSAVPRMPKLDFSDIFRTSLVNKWSIEPGVFGDPVVVATVPFGARGSQDIYGISSIATSLRAMTSYLTSMELLGGFLYVVWQKENGDPRVIAVSYNMEATDNLCQAQNASNPIVAGAAKFLESHFGNELRQNIEVHQDNVVLSNSKYYVDTMPLTGSQFDNLKLTAVVVIPRKSIMGRIESWKQTVVAVTVAIAISIAVVGCILICGLTSKMSTEMHLKQELIRQLIAKNRAEQSSNHKSQFLANMSHELRTPMAGIIGLLDLLSCDTLTSEQEMSVAQIRRCALGLLTMVDNALDISKVESGKLELDLAPFSLADELESLVDMFAAQSFSSGVDVALDLADKIPHAMKGDALRIRQIFSNLLANSLKFTEHGHIVIRGWVDESHHACQPLIALPPSKVNNIVLFFEVDDTGCGVPPHMHESVFESFVQADSSSTRIHGGSGLGLCIVRSLVQKMGGEVRIIPKQEPGTLIRFHIVLERLTDVVVESVVSSPSPDSLSSLIGSPSLVQTPSFDLLERTQVLVAMAPGITAGTCVRWLEKQGMKVTHVSRWTDIIPAVEAMVKSVGVDSKLATREWRKAGYTSDATNDSPLDSSGGCSSRTLESFLDLNSCPVLALIDVALFSCDKPSEPDFSIRDTSSRSEACRISPPLLDVLNLFSRIHSRHSLAVGWIVAPDSGIVFKKTLQVTASSVILIKPLHASRMRRLLALVQRSCKVELTTSEPLSCVSSDPSTPRLNTPVREDAEEVTYAMKQADEPVPSSAGTPRLHVTISPDVAYHSDEYMLSTPCSPTSGLLTPEGADTTADGVQEAKKGVKELENEWSGPVIPLPKSTYSARSPFSLPESEISTRPSTTNSSPIHAASVLGANVLSDLHILVVEDTPVLQRMVSTMLRKFGAHVTVVSDGQQAVTIVAQAVHNSEESLESDAISFDLILMDCAMPVMDGYSATRAIREAEVNTSRHIPIVALTAHNLTSDEEKCRAAGMDDYLTKPINCKLLVSTIVELVTKKAGPPPR